MRSSTSPFSPVTYRDGPGQLFKGLLCFTLKIKMLRSIVPEAEGRSPVTQLRRGGVSQIVDGIVDAVIREFLCAVQLQAFYNAGVGRISVGVGFDIVSLIHCRPHAAGDRGEGSKRTGGKDSAHRNAGERSCPENGSGRSAGEHSGKHGSRDPADRRTTPAHCRAAAVKRGIFFPVPGFNISVKIHLESLLCCLVTIIISLPL